MPNPSCWDLWKKPWKRWAKGTRYTLTICKMYLNQQSPLISPPAVGSCGRRTQSLNVLPLKPGVSQYIAIFATLTARDFSLISTLLVHSPAFFPNLSLPPPLFLFLPVLAVANTGSCVGPRNKNRPPCWMQVPVLSALGM